MKLKAALPITAAFILTLAFNNCSDNDSPDTLAINTVKTRCLSVQANDCHQGNENSLMFMGIIETRTSGCKDLLEESNMSLLNTLFDASAVGQVSFSSSPSSLSAEFSNWVGADNLNILNLNNKQQLVCGFIDSNSNGFLDLTEPILEQNIQMQDINVLTLENWENH